MIIPKKDKDWIKLKRDLEKKHPEVFYYMTLQKFKSILQVYLGKQSFRVH